MFKFAMTVFSGGLLVFVTIQARLSTHGGATKMYPISGVVLFDGEPLAEGEIVFQDANSEVSHSTLIKDGHYEFKTTEGVKKVMITAWKTDPNGTQQQSNLGSHLSTPQVQYLPDRYNIKTVLAATVQDGKTEFQFELDSRKKIISQR